MLVKSRKRNWLLVKKEMAWCLNLVFKVALPNAVIEPLLTVRIFALARVLALVLS